jgi:hypothetical protein
MPIFLVCAGGRGRHNVVFGGDAATTATAAHVEMESWSLFFFFFFSRSLVGFYFLFYLSYIMEEGSLCCMRISNSLINGFERAMWVLMCGYDNPASSR